MVDARSLLVSGSMVLCAVVCGTPAVATDENDARHYRAPHAQQPPRVDGSPTDRAWNRAAWRPVQYRWLGPDYSAEDFEGRYKVVWTEERIYVLLDFVDDVLIDTHRDPLVQYWDDDTLEVFVDEDRSGGDHQYNHNAFAYHFSLDNQAIDIDVDKQAKPFTDHTESRWRQYKDRAVWEVSIAIYPDSYRYGDDDSRPVQLEPGKRLGFMLAYCDNDGSELRENFIGSVPIDGQKDRGWIDAGVFGVLELVE